MEIPRFRPFRIVAGTTVALATLATASVGYHMADNYFDGDAADKEFDQQLSDAYNDSPVSPVIEAIDQAPIVGRADDTLQTTLDRPRHEAEACMRVAPAIQAEEAFQPQYELGEQVAAQIGLARTQGEIVGLLDNFLDINGIELYYNSVSHPANFDRIDWATKDLDINRLHISLFDDTQPEATDILRQHAAGIALGASQFSREFNDDQVDFLVLAGNVKTEASATAHDGLLHNGIVIELESQAGIVNASSKTVHEIGHTFQFHIISELGVPNMSELLEPYGSLTPRGFRFAEASGRSVDAIATAYPAYFVPGPEQVFARPYGALNVKEHGATTISDMLIGSGIIGMDSDSWGSLYQQNQANQLTCFEIAMPGFTKTTIARQLDTGLVEDGQDYAAYMNAGPKELSALIQT